MLLVEVSEISLDKKQHNMKYALVFLLALAGSGALIAQTENIWQGGFPGRETDWEMAANWSQNRIPNEFDIAVIPDCSTRGGFYPVVWIEEPVIKGLRLLSGASLHIVEGAILVVDSDDDEDPGVLLQGDLRIEGRFIILHQAGPADASADLGKH